MIELISIQDLFSLAPDEKFYVIEKGNCLQYRYCSVNPRDKNAAVAITDHAHLKATVFMAKDFNEHKRGKVFLKGLYDSKVVGAYMISQLENEIESVREIYFK